jgi:hypothetical protein
MGSLSSTLIFEVEDNPGGEIGGYTFPVWMQEFLAVVDGSYNIEATEFEMWMKCEQRWRDGISPIDAYPEWAAYEGPKYEAI